MHQEMNYDPVDILRLARGVPFTALRRPAAFADALHEQLSALNLTSIHNTYTLLARQEQCEFTTALCRLLSVYDESLRDDLLCSSSHKKMIMLGALMCLLVPSETDLPILRNISAKQTKIPWLVEFAVKRANKDFNKCEADIDNLIAELRKSLRRLELPHVELWRISDIPMEGFCQFQLEFAEIYKADGADAALAFLCRQKEQNTEIGKYLCYRFPDQMSHSSVSLV